MRPPQVPRPVSARCVCESVLAAGARSRPARVAHLSGREQPPGLVIARGRWPGAVSEVVVDQAVAGALEVDLGDQVAGLWTDTTGGLANDLWRVVGITPGGQGLAYVLAEDYTCCASAPCRAAEGEPAPFASCPAGGPPPQR